MRAGVVAAMNTNTTLSKVPAVTLGFWVIKIAATRASHVLLFWAAFILTRPLGATVGDFLDTPLDHGGLALSRPIASLVLGAFALACILLLPQRAGEHPGKAA
jgi:uncharacterized membrane-anchored protein